VGADSEPSSTALVSAGIAIRSVALLPGGFCDRLARFFHDQRELPPVHQMLLARHAGKVSL
jgi:hypothetical protein